MTILFLAAKRFESGKAVRGAFLLTDLDTKPLEFRCTNPIRPTSLQTVLYGEILEQHIITELIGLPLINSLKSRPAVILVTEIEFLGIRPKMDIPIVHLTNEESVQVPLFEEDAQEQLLHSDSGMFEPILLAAHPKFAQDKEIARDILRELFNSYDILEPFERIDTALEQVHAQKVGDGN